MPKVGVALSGGGYRATLFGLGVLMYLVDSGKNRDVNVISSVSGGSITNGLIAQTKGFQTTSATAFRQDVGPLARTVATEALWASWPTYIYLAVLVASLAAIVYVCFWLLPIHIILRVIIFVILLLPWGYLLQQRGHVAGRAYGAKLYSPTGSPTKLADIEHNIDHVICATHLNAGEHMYFGGRFVYSYRFGWGTPGNLPLHAAVQASSAFPGGFPPRWMRTKRFGFSGGTEKVPRLVTLTDGGVYDNMADQWPSHVKDRAQRNPGLGLQVPEELLVVNSSAGLGWSLVRKLRVPFFGEFRALMRVVSVLQDNATSLRSASLYNRFVHPHGDDVRGVLVAISRSPFALPRQFASVGNTPEAQRALAAMAKLGSSDEWDKITNANVNVATTLSKLGTTVSARLMRHGYAIAMANCHTILDYPLLDIPDHSTFEALTT